MADEDQKNIKVCVSMSMQCFKSPIRELLPYSVLKPSVINGYNGDPFLSIF